MQDVPNIVRVIVHVEEPFNDTDRMEEVTMKASPQMKHTKREFFVVVGHSEDDSHAYATCASFQNVRQRIARWNGDAERGWRSHVYAATYVRVTCHHGTITVHRPYGYIVAEDCEPKYTILSCQLCPRRFRVRVDDKEQSPLCPTCFAEQERR